MHLDLSEVLYTHLDFMRIPVAEQNAYQLYYEGFVVDSEATPITIGLVPGMVHINILEVREVGWKKYEDQLMKMNRIGATLNIKRDVSSGGFLCPNTLNHVFSFLEMSSLLDLTLVSTYVHLISQRYSLLMQLQFGSFSSLSPLNYPAWIDLLQEYSHCISKATCQQRARSEMQWKSINFHKLEGDKCRDSFFFSYGRHGNRHQFQKVMGW